jgi:hypothetical protein
LTGDRVPGLCQPCSYGDTSGRAAHAVDLRSTDVGRWKLGFSLVVGSWTLALQLRIRTLNRTPVARS